MVQRAEIEGVSTMYAFIIVIIALNSTFFVIPNHHYKKKKNIILINTVESKNSFISYVIIDGTICIVKQKKDETKLLSIVRDALAAYIAQDLCVAHSAKIIPSKENFPGKKYVKSPGVILSLAAGATVRSQPESKYHNLCLKQRKPDGDLLPNRWLTETIIHQITWHKQLPVIIGLDLFIGNTDRHGGNLFYDPKTDSFCAIDMDNIFRRDLPALAYKKLKLMIHNKKKFTREEIAALISVRNTILFLLDSYSTKDIIAKLHFFIKEVDFPQAVLRSEKMIKKITRHETMIMQSRRSLYKLIKILNEIVVNI